jgi:hypothetical protein
MCDGVNGYSGELEAQNKSMVKINFRDGDERDYSCKWIHVKLRK